jgi:Na+-driven multidrug efflux pump
MSVANIWLNGVTGTGKTRTNLAIEIIAISVYLIYTYIFTKLHYTTLAMAWSNEMVYWTTIFLMSFLFFKSGKWKVK